ncbi:zinc finger protein 28-like isoform X1 [Pieris brassicae]|uniref:Uncharacterized protein n=1 Tax=Pieris brassicae TaxID=7116 RepID=A0A9P0T231_PIEBR|nr:zinc finger protein 28-like isoform X1 [Pieris brassicae]XP_045524962.1 zinc finger protein 28-like isoform X1 [Pieris brassicae]CAH3979091.1 unnamed protein product [Pieris brassicae]
MAVNLCRICLESGATIPLFVNRSNILTKLSFCVNETITDTEGYPKNICSNCKHSLFEVYNFITKFKETHNILRNKLLVKQEEFNYSLDSCIGQIEVKIKQENFKNECSDDEPLCGFSQIKKESETENKSKERIRLNKLRQSFKKNLTRTNTIASSILEGEFVWIGDTWCLNTTKVSTSKKKETSKLKQKQNRVDIKLPKEKVEKPKVPKLCDLCGVTFKSLDKLAIHKRNIHFKKPTKCPECPQILASNYYLNRHIRRCHKKEDNFICATCGRGFTFRGEMMTHVKNVHNKHLKPRKTFSCDLCDKVFKCQKSVTIHIRSAHTGQRPAVCTVCDSSFFHEDYLKEHMRLHTGETPFKCPVCGRGYAQLGNMKSHLRIHRKSEVNPDLLSKLRPNYLRLLKP